MAHQEEEVPDCEYFRYIPPSVNLVEGETNQIGDIPRKKSAISFKDSYLELEIVMIHQTGAHDQHSYGHPRRLVNLRFNALSRKYRLTSSSYGKGKEKKTMLVMSAYCINNYQVAEIALICRLVFISRVRIANNNRLILNN